MNIRFRNVKRNKENVVVSGTAALVKNTYRQNANGNRLQNHSQQKVIERLGKVVWRDEYDSTIGIFNSPTRGLVFYDLSKDEFIPVNPADPRLKGTKYQNQPARIHTCFGDTYLFLSEMAKTPFMNVLREAFPDKVLFQKVLAHLCHDCLKNGSFIKCGEFLVGNWLSYILTDIPVSTLDCDSAYFAALYDDNLKVNFFRALIKEMRKTRPLFGVACYVDSTPLPGEAENNPFNALCSHGTDGAVIQSRLVLVLDIETCIPVWFEIITSTVLDKSTILSITNDLKVTLDIDITMYDLDAGYAKKELFELFNRENSMVQDENGVTREHTLLIRMPATPGYPKDELYIGCKPNFYNGRYSFDYEHHTFYGERIEIELFGVPEYAFVFIDKTQAESLLRGWREGHLEEWEELSDSAKDWYQVKDGFFVLIGNKDQSPKEALVEYRGRAHIETFFRDGKAYLRILPLGKWTKETVMGKIFHDVIETIFYRAYRKQVSTVGMSMSSLLVHMESWECVQVDKNLLELKTPRTQAREIMEKLGYAVPGHMDLNGLRAEIFEGVAMDREPVTIRKKRKSSKPALPISPEEKRDAKEQEQKSKALEEAEKRLSRSEAKAKRILDKAIAVADTVCDKTKARAARVLTGKLQTAKRGGTKEQAMMAYKQALKEADKAREQSYQEAKSVYEKAMKEAKAAFEQEKAGRGTHNQSTVD